MSTTCKVILSFGLAALICSAPPISGQTLAVRGAEIHTMAGDVIASGVILIEGGKIVAVGPDIPIPQAAEIIEASGFVLYPGFMAPFRRLAAKEIDDYESVSPDYSALDAADPMLEAGRLLAGGITAVYLDTPKNRLISGYGAVVKVGTGGAEPNIVKADAALRINLDGGAVLPPMIKIYPAPVSPANPITPAWKQFPSSALGAYWQIRDLFHSGGFSGDLANYRNAIHASLERAREQKIPLLVECRKAVEIGQALELAAEVSMPLIISGGGEAAQMAEVLSRQNVPVLLESIAGPNRLDSDMSGRAGKRLAGRPCDIAALIAKGVLVALDPPAKEDVPDLLWISQYYRRYGLSGEDLVKTITINPARIFGVGQRLGSLENGKDADILFFQAANGSPLPRLKKVMIEGRIVHEQD
jgi:hypothetical protein